jgi:hypothetical protein
MNITLFIAIQYFESLGKKGLQHNAMVLSWNKCTSVSGTKRTLHKMSKVKRV